MFSSNKAKEWLNWPLIRAHMNTLALAFSFHNTWRAPREALRYGGLPYMIVFTVAMATFALPVVLLQLSIGQLSQQDAVGVWKAVPFFRGVGYLRLLVSFLASMFSCIYMSLSIAYFLYTISNSIPFRECMEFIPELEEFENVYNASECLDATFMSPVYVEPEYYLAVALIITVLWVTFPFLFYYPVKFMKRIFYVLGPVILILGIVVTSYIGDWANMQSFVETSDWANFLEPDIWHSALVQAQLSSQIAGGFLIAAGDSIYSTTNVQWTTLAFVGTSLVFTWVCTLFWYSVTSPCQRSTGMAGVLVQIYQISEENDYQITWSLIMFAMLILSGLITMLSVVYPIFDRLRRVGGMKWRAATMCASIIGAGLNLAVLVGRLPALALLEDIVVPVVTSITTVLEISAFVFIYGWKSIVEDVEFLTGRELSKFWVVGWWVTPGIITPIFAWWITMVFLRDTEWAVQPWLAATATTTIALIFAILIICASYAVSKQVQYDVIAKLKSSFKPSRHWGPRDPITHYYWLARRDETDRNVPRNRYTRRQLGQLSRRPSNLQVPNVTPITGSLDLKRRPTSDDWLYTVYRRMCTDISQVHDFERKRSKSLDWGATGGFKQSLYGNYFNNEL